VRLRHGFFTVDCPDACGLCVFSGHPVGDGIFAEDEREYWLGKGLEAIEAWLASVRHPVGYCDKCNSDSRAYYDGEHDNFYCETCHKGMGTPFYVRHAAAFGVTHANIPLE